MPDFVWPLLGIQSLIIRSPHTFFAVFRLIWQPGNNEHSFGLLGIKERAMMIIRTASIASTLVEEAIVKLTIHLIAQPPNSGAPPG